MIDKLTALAQHRIGRVVAAIVGIGLISLVVRAAGARTVVAAIRGAAWWFPLIVLGQLGMIFFEVLAIRALYAEDKHKLPARALARSGLISFAVNAVVPAGRAAAEVTRAALLAKHTSAARASVAALQMQGLLLVANSVISVPCAVALFWFRAPTLLRILILVNVGATLALGAGVLFVGRKARLGERVGRRLGEEEVGEEFDRMMAVEPKIRWNALGWTVMGRVAQVAQYGVLVAAIGGVTSVGKAFAAEAIQLVGASVGDLVPANLGATESSFDLSARVLGVTAGGAISMALLAHVAQLAIAVCGFLVPIVWPARAAAAAEDPAS